MLTIVFLFLFAVGTESWNKYDCDNDGDVDCKKWDYGGAKCSQPLLSPDHIHAKVICVKGASFGVLGKLTSAWHLVLAAKRLLTCLARVTKFLTQSN